MPLPLTKKTTAKAEQQQEEPLWPMQKNIACVMNTSPFNGATYRLKEKGK
jgi:hypothetical protein